MRELKFRAFDLKTKEIKQVDSIYFYNKEDENGNLGEVSLVGEKVTKYFGNGNLKQVEIMQYTGLKDQNGKEIYEGDIVKGYFNHGIQFRQGEVKFSNGRFMVNGITYVSLHEFLVGNDNNLEVIGNIYENPELLNK